MKRLHQAFRVLAAVLGAALGTAALATPAIQQQFAKECYRQPG